MPPVPKPRIGQGRAGITWKPKVSLPIPKVIQMPTLPMPMPTPRTVLSLTEHVTQSTGKHPATASSTYNTKAPDSTYPIQHHTAPRA